MTKVIWLLPAETTLSQLGTLLSKLLRRFIITEPVEKVL